MHERIKLLMCTRKEIWKSQFSVLHLWWCVFLFLCEWANPLMIYSRFVSYNWRQDGMVLISICSVDIRIKCINHEINIKGTYFPYFLLCSEEKKYWIRIIKNYAFQTCSFVNRTIAGFFLFHLKILNLKIAELLCFSDTICYTI